MASLQQLNDKQGIKLSYSIDYKTCKSLKIKKKKEKHANTKIEHMIRILYRNS